MQFIQTLDNIGILSLIAIYGLSITDLLFSHKWSVLLKHIESTHIDVYTIIYCYKVLFLLIKRSQIIKGIVLASFPGPARSSLAVRNSRRGPGLIHHVMRAAGVILRHTRYSKNRCVAEITTNGVGRTWNRSRTYDRLQ